MSAPSTSQHSKYYKYIKVRTLCPCGRGANRGKRFCARYHPLLTKRALIAAMLITDHPSEVARKLGISRQRLHQIRTGYKSPSQRTHNAKVLAKWHGN